MSVPFRYEITIKSGRKIVHRVSFHDYEEAMDALDFCEENWAGHTIEFVDHKLYTGKVK